MVRKTRLMSTAGVMLIRVEVFDQGILRSTVFKVSTATASQTFTAPAKAIGVFRALARHPAEAPRRRLAA